jgi:hypothetical protein
VVEDDLLSGRPVEIERRRLQRDRAEAARLHAAVVVASAAGDRKLQEPEDRPFPMQSLDAVAMGAGALAAVAVDAEVEIDHPQRLGEGVVVLEVEVLHHLPRRRSLVAIPLVDRSIALVERPRERVVPAREVLHDPCVDCDQDAVHDRDAVDRGRAPEPAHAEVLVREEVAAGEDGEVNDVALRRPFRFEVLLGRVPAGEELDLDLLLLVGSELLAHADLPLCEEVVRLVRLSADLRREPRAGRQLDPFSASIELLQRRLGDAPEEIHLAKGAPGIPLPLREQVEHAAGREHVACLAAGGRSAAEA